MAIILADLGMTTSTIAAALLHDAVEDTGVTLEDIEREFGAEVAAIVDGVTKLERIQFDSKEAQQAATMRKMLVAMAKDLRVLLIKLADRLHNMRTIAALPEGSRSAPRRRRSTSTRRWPTGSACRTIKWQLEDLVLRRAAPEAVRRDRADGRHPRARARVYLAQVLEEVRAAAGRAAASRPRSRAGRSTLVHLREDGRPRQGVRRDLRPRRHPGASSTR